MPQIPMKNADLRGGVLDAPTASPQSFGYQAGEGASEFGRAMVQVGEKIQAQQDKLDLANLAGAHAEAMDALKPEIAKEPDAKLRAERFKREATNLQTRLFAENPNLSSSVKQAFAVHTAEQNARAFIDVSHQANVNRANRAVADFTDTENRLTEKAALEVDPAKAAQHMSLLNELRTSMVQGGVLTPEAAQKRQESAQHRYWSIYAQHKPEALLDLVNHPQEGGENIAGMDAEKRNTYVNLAINTLHARQSATEDQQKKADKLLKEQQEITASQLKADALEGKSVQEKLAPLLRARLLDSDKVASILELQEKLAKVPDMAQYQRGLATRIETELSRMQYDGKPFNQALMDGLQSDYVQGHLLKDEFTHLSALARTVKAHKENETQAPRNSDISRAAANLEQVMESANKLTGFSAVGNQATAAAKEYFYRRVAQDEKANPWDVMHEAESRFKPLVEKQQGVSKVDQMLLDDAKLDSHVQLGTITPAAAKAMREKEQGNRGSKVVSEALKALPPPPAPGFFERLFQKKQTPEKKPAAGNARKQPGVMGE